MVQGKKILGASLFAVASFLTMQGTSLAATYTEFPTDAGQTLATAQPTASAANPAGTALSTIFGTFSTGADADLFVIRITAPGSFSATTNNTVTNSTFLDTALFLFDSTGKAIATNDDASGSVVSSTLPTGNTLFASLAAGTYYLGISGSGNEAVNAVNQLLFAGYPGGDTTAVRGTASGLNPATLSTFNGNVTFSQTGSYEIDLTSVATAAAVPEPSTWAALALGSIAAGATILRRRNA